MEPEENKLVEERREKLKALRGGGVAFPNDFRRKDLAADLGKHHAGKSKEQLEKEKPQAIVAGRMMLKRVMGKAPAASRPTSRRTLRGTRSSSTGISATSSAWKGTSSRR